MARDALPPLECVREMLNHGTKDAVLPVSVVDVTFTLRVALLTAL